MNFPGSTYNLTFGWIYIQLLAGSACMELWSMKWTPFCRREEGVKWVERVTELCRSQVCNYNIFLTKLSTVLIILALEILRETLSYLVFSVPVSVTASGQTKQEGRHGKLRDIDWDLVNREYQLLSRHITIIDCSSAAQPRVITVPRTVKCAKWNGWRHDGW